LLILRQDGIPFPLVNAQLIFQWTEAGQTKLSDNYLLGARVDASLDVQVPGPDADLDVVYLFYREGTQATAPKRLVYLFNHPDWRPGQHWSEMVVAFNYVATNDGLYYGTEQFIK
jgi:hypothetical protein